MINIEVYSTHAVIRSQQPLTVGLTGASAHFAFGKPWDQLIKTAVFRQGEKTVTVADIGQQVQIPWEVLTLPGVPVMIGVYGTDPEGKLVIPTLWAETEPVRPGADPQVGVTPADPTAPVWAQLQSNMGSREQLNTNDKTSLVAAINEANRAVMAVTVSGADGSYETQTTMAELSVALDAGKSPQCYWEEHGVWLPLSKLDIRKTGISFADFSMTAKNKEYYIHMTGVSGGDMEVTGSVTVLATGKSKLPNPEKLTLIGSATAEYDGSAAVSVHIPTKVSQLLNDSGFLTQAPVTSVNGQTGAVAVSTAIKVQVWQKNDGSYDYSHNSLRIMNALSDGNTVFCRLGTHYLLSLVYATPAKCIFTGVYEGELYAVTVTSTGATVSTTPLSSGGSGADGLLFDEITGTLYLMQSGQIIGNGVQLPTSGEGPTNNAVLTLENTTGWSSKTMPNDADCMISFDWSSVDGEVSTGSGTVTVKVENELQYSANIKQGANTISIMEYLRLGENRIDVTVTDFRGNSKSLLFLVSMFDPANLKSTKLVDRTLTGDYINGRVTKVGPYAFHGLTLNLLSLPNVTEVAECAFITMVADEVDIPSLTSIEISTWMIRAATIGVVKLPSVTAIGGESLWDTREVGRIVFNSLETIGVSLKNGNNIKIYDFHALTSLRSLPHHGSQYSIIIRTPTVCTLQDAPISQVLSYVSLYVPRDLVDSYKVATNWSSIADKIFAIEDYPEIDGGAG